MWRITLLHYGGAPVLSREGSLHGVGLSLALPAEVQKSVLADPPQILLNLKTARALGLTLPQSLLLRTDEVIE